MHQALDQTSLGVGRTNPSWNICSVKMGSSSPIFGVKKKLIEVSPPRSTSFLTNLLGPTFSPRWVPYSDPRSDFSPQIWRRFPLTVHWLQHLFFLYMSIIPVGGWTYPFEKYDRQIGPFPQSSGWTDNIFEITTWHMSIETLGCDKKFIIRI